MFVDCDCFLFVHSLAMFQRDHYAVWRRSLCFLIVLRAKGNAKFMWRCHAYTICKCENDELADTCRMCNVLDVAVVSHKGRALCMWLTDTVGKSCFAHASL